MTSHIKSNTDSSSLNLFQLQLKTSVKTFVAYMNEYEHINISDTHIDDIKLKSKRASNLNKSAGLEEIFAYYNKDTNKIELTQTEANDEQFFAHGQYTRSRYETGWDKLRIKTYSNVNPLIQCWTAGYIEGLMSAEEIADYYDNIHVFFHGKENVIDDIKNFYAKVDQNLKEKITVDKFKNLNTGRHDSFNELRHWSYITCFHAQLNGLHAGYNKIADKKLDLLDFYFINSEGNFGDLRTYMKINQMKLEDNAKFYSKENLKKVYDTDYLNEIWKNLTRNGHCSAIVKLIPTSDGEYDMIAGHNTWSEYCEMMRTLKYIEFAFEGKHAHAIMKSRTVSYSSYPGVLFSGDDFYEIDSKLVLLQTTLSSLNKLIYRDILNIDNYIPEFMRIMITNHLSETGEEWAMNYAKYKNHMYITQWIILDYNVLKTLKKDSDPKGLVTLVEEVPGSIIHIDVSKQTVDDTYFGSFNLAHFPQHQEILGLKFGLNDFTVQKYSPRGFILQNIHSSITDVDSFSKVIQYNGYKTKGMFNGDPSVIDPGNGISARNDLALDPYFQGGIDFKIVSKDLVDAMSIYAYGGPAYAFNPNLKPFDFNMITNYRENYHKGIPTVWDFKPFYFSENSFQR